MRTDIGLPDWVRHRFNLFNTTFDRTTTTVVAMIAIDIIWWMMIYNGYVPMPEMGWLMEQGIPPTAPGAMELGVFQIGTLTAFASFIVMWGVMMWAMMYPAMTRFIREYVASHKGSAHAATTAVIAFLGGYQIVWALSGIIPLMFHAVLPGGIYGFTQAHIYFVIGGVLVLTGFYQLSTFKRSRLRTCCAHIYPHTDGIGKALKRGAIHGVTCVLISFGPFFLLMPFFGEMNPFWMVALTGVVTVERLPEWGHELSSASGIIALLAGSIVLILQPALPIAFTMSM